MYTLGKRKNAVYIKQKHAAAAESPEGIAQVPASCFTKFTMRVAAAGMSGLGLLIVYLII